MDVLKKVKVLPRLLRANRSTIWLDQTYKVESQNFLDPVLV